MITDEEGNEESHHAYFPFGEEIAPMESYNTHQFTGHERDEETGLDYMMARYYNPSSAFRFLSVDPMLRSKTNRSLQTWNRYSYSLQNPLKYIDPEGKVITLKTDDEKLMKSREFFSQSSKFQEMHDTRDINATIRAGRFFDKKGKEYQAGSKFERSKDGKIKGEIVVNTVNKDTGEPLTQEEVNKLLGHELGHLKDLRDNPKENDECEEQKNLEEDDEDEDEGCREEEADKEGEKMEKEAK